MTLTTDYTTTQLSREIGVPVWRIRRVLDAMGVPVPRVGLYRVIPPHLAEQIIAELSRRGLLPKQREATNA